MHWNVDYEKCKLETKSLLYTAFIPLTKSSFEDFGLVQLLYIVSKCENGKIDGQGMYMYIEHPFGLLNKLLIILSKKMRTVKSY